MCWFERKIYFRSLVCVLFSWMVPSMELILAPLTYTYICKTPYIRYSLCLSMCCALSRIAIVIEAAASLLLLWYGIHVCSQSVALLPYEFWKFEKIEKKVREDWKESSRRLTIGGKERKIENVEKFDWQLTLNELWKFDKKTDICDKFWQIVKRNEKKQ